jgi:hypothetical protein
MSSHIQTAYELLWCAHPVLQSILAVAMWRRGLYKQFRVFFSYTLIQVAIFCITFPLWRIGNYEWFFWAYWLGAAISAIVSFKIIHEIFLDVFRPYHSLKDLGTILFRWAGTVMLMVAAVVAFSSSPHYYPIVHAVTTLQRSVRFVQFGLIVFLLLFSRYLGVSRRHYSFGTALGFGFFAGTELLLLALNSGGLIHQNSLNLVDTIAFNVGILIWLGYAHLSQPAKEVPDHHYQTDRWEESLADLQHPEESDSLIPMFEGMVERALSRTSNVANMPPVNSGAKPPGSAVTPRGIAATAGAGGRTRN